MSDQTLRLIRELRPEGQAAAISLINAYRRAGWPAIVVEARRGIERQRALLRSGATRTLRSNHLTGRAFDLAFAGVPTQQVPHEIWLAGHSFWSALGGRPPIITPTFTDLVHFEFD